MVDLAVWLDEFLYVLFDHIERLDEDKTKSRVLTRSLSKVSESQEEKDYYDKVSNASLGLGVVDDIKFSSGKTVLSDAVNVLKNLNLSPTKMLPLE